MTDADGPSFASETCPSSGKDDVAVRPCFAECCDPSELLDLSGSMGLVIGIANERSLAWPAAMHFRRAGAELAITYVNERTRSRVEPLARQLEAPIVLPCDVAVPDQLEAVYAAISQRWGRLDFLLHAIGAVPPTDLHGRLTDSSAEGFAKAVTVSVHSLMRMARLAEPLMTKGDSILTLSYLGAERVVESYNVMGPVKAALEGSVRYLAHELGPGGTRVNAISAGPVQTRAASGLTNFGSLLSASARVAPLRRNVSGDAVGHAALLLVSDYASAVTGEVLHVDAGGHVDGPIGQIRTRKQDKLGNTMRAKDIMTTNIVSISEEGSIDQAVELMLDNRISAIPILDDEKRLLGLISEGDLIRRMRDGQAQHRSWWLELLSNEGAALDYIKARSELVADVMTRNVITVDEDTKVEDIALTLERNRIKRVPVTKDGIAVGIVSRADLIQAIALSRNGRLPVPKLEDETLRRQVLKAISTAPGGSVSSVSLQVENGSVTIWGTAEGEAVKQAIRVAAENVDGVRSVQVYMDKVPPWVYGI